MRRLLGSLAVALVLAGGSAPAEQASAPALVPEQSLFDAPHADALLRQVLQLIRTGRTEDALTAGQGAAARYPARPAARLAHALALAAAAEAEAAFAELAEAVRLGSPSGQEALGSPLFRALGQHPGEAAVLAALGEAPGLLPPKPAKVIIEALTAPVSAENTLWNPTEMRFESRFAVPPVLARRPVAGRIPGLERLVPFVNRWYASEGAAGLAGVLYDNRDRGHSSLPREHFPQLLHTAYAEPASKRNLDYGPNRHFEFGRITFGNSSTAITSGPYWRSQTRRMLTEPGGAERLAAQYAQNMLYVYPEKSDHGEKGADLFPANTPYAITSQGASGSDRPFLRAIALTLAAMPRAVRDRAEAEGLVAPLLQRLLRQSQRGAEGREGYLSAAAHPSAFRAEDLDLEGMLRQARALRLEDLAPPVRLTLLRRPRLSGFEATGVLQPELLFETPSAIALVHRGLGPAMVLELSAGATRDPLDRPLRFEWRVLRGDAERIRIEPLSEDTSRVRITVPWHEPFPVPGRPEGAPPLTSHRVGIAVFADTGAGLSAPAFVNLSYPPDQQRRYDGQGRLLEIDHSGSGYADPWLYPRRDWRDVFDYDDAGALSGWTRYRTGKEPERFDGQGRRQGPDGPTAVRYAPGSRNPRDGRVPVLVEPFPSE